MFYSPDATASHSSVPHESVDPACFCHMHLQLQSDVLALRIHKIIPKFNPIFFCVLVI